MTKFRKGDGCVVYTEEHETVDEALNSFTEKIEAFNNTHPDMTVKGHIEEVDNKQILTVRTLL